MKLEDACDQLRTLLDEAARRRVIIGLVGEPGAGKSTCTAALLEQAAVWGIAAACLPMDGFHLADVELDRLGLRDRKGAIETFDAHGYLHTLDRVRRDESGVPVYAPGFERDLEQPIAGAIAILPEHRLVITEGNYLLDESAPWPQVKPLLDAVWAVAVDDDLRRSRLVARHVQFGKSPDAAQAWVESVDEPNAVRIRDSLGRADATIEV